jgi:hypothetical protein
MRADDGQEVSMRARGTTSGALLTGVVTALVLGGSTGAAQHPEPNGPRGPAASHVAATEIPNSIAAEHEEIQEALVRATLVPGRVGEAARAVAALLDPHFAREEQIALPPLGLLRAISDGEPTAGMAAMLPVTDSLAAELPRMLEEHEAIRAAVDRLGAAARSAGRRDEARLAEQLRSHALTEEEVLYPAAVLVGKYLKAALHHGPEARCEHATCPMKPVPMKPAPTRP